jgi:hypothetical protein
VKDPEIELRGQKFRGIRKALAQKNDTEKEIAKGKKLWTKVSRKKLFITMMGHMDNETLDRMKIQE